MSARPMAAFGFREVTDPAIAMSSDGRALEQMHKLLQQQPRERFAVHDGILADVSPSTPTGPLLLLGIMSGNEVRRQKLRCGWERHAGPLLSRLRVLFVVGAPRRAAPACMQWYLSGIVNKLLA